MTITVTDIDQGPYTATGAAQTVGYTFMTLTDAEIAVYYDAGYGRVLIDLALHVVEPNKNVDGSAKEGGSVVLDAGAVPSGASIYLRAAPRSDRDIVWSDTGSRLRNLNDEGDRLTLRLLTQGEVLSRAVVAAPGQNPPGPQDVIDAATAVALKQDKSFALANVASAVAVARDLAVRLLDALIIYAADYGVVAGSSGAAAANSTTINALMAYLAGLGGGRLILPRGSVYIGATLDNKYPGVLVEGYMRSRFHDGGTPVFGTTLIPTAAFTPLKHRTPFAAEQSLPAASVAKNTGGGFKNLRVVGNALAARLLEVTSVASAEYDLYLESAVGDAAAYFTAGISGTDMGEAADVQDCSIHLNIRQIDAGSDNAHGVVFAGSSNANVSLNADIRIFAQHKNGHALFGKSMDNNDLWVIATRVSGGTGKTVLLGDAAAYDQNIGGNTFHRLSGNGGSHLLGTDTAGAIANFNTVVNYDDGNGSPVLTAGAGSGWLMLSDTFGYASGTAHGPTAFGVDRTSATEARGAMGSETVRIRNGSNNHVRLDDGVNEWGVNIDAATGNLRIVRISGSGIVQVAGDFLASNGYFSEVNIASALSLEVGGVLESSLFRAAAGAMGVITNRNSPGSERYYAFGADGDFNILSGGLAVSGTRVVGVQGAAVANATDAASVITQLNTLLARLRAHGLIAT